MKEYRLTDWLPTTKKEVELRGWDELDVILFSGDAYVDHPSFGAAVIGRILEAEGLKIAIVPQPNWRDDLRDFKKLGRPRLFFGISPGCMDSMVNKYTANKRLRSDDAYTPDARPDMRPEYPSIVYTQILKKLFPDVPVVLGGIEASMRRLTHYDYWQDRVRPSILLDSGADSLIYGMGEKPVVELAERLKRQQTQMDAPSFKKLIADIPQMVYLDKEVVVQEGDITLFSHEECLKDKKKEAANFRHIEEESNKYTASRILQKSGKLTVVVNPPYPPLTEAELDRSFDLPYTRLPHPKYKGKRIPAYDMSKFSVNIHRGCFGGCAFCTISAHQGKFIVSRSKESILKESEPKAEPTANPSKEIPLPQSQGVILSKEEREKLLRAAEKPQTPTSGGRSVDELLKRTPKAESFAQTAVPYRREELKPKEEQPIELKPIVSDEKTEEVKPTEEKQPFFQNYKIIGQVFRTYWIVEQGDCLYLIDQHAAHERVLYEEFMNKFKEERVASQRLLTPLMLQLTPMETEVLRRNLALLESFGFELEEFGEKYALRATPYLLQNPTEVGFFTDILDRLTEERISNVYDTKILAVATMACKAAVKGHDVLSTREAEELIHSLLGLEHPFTCPHGRPTIIELTKYEMEKMFKRIQN